MPSQIMPNRGPAEAEPGQTAPSLETIKEHSVNNSHQESQHQSRRQHFKILTKEEWRQEMMREDYQSRGPSTLWREREGEEARNAHLDRRGRSHDVVPRWQRPPYPAVNAAGGEVPPRQDRAGDLYAYAAIQPYRDSRNRSSDERDANENSYESTGVQRLATGSFNLSHL